MNLNTNRRRRGAFLTGASALTALGIALGVSSCGSDATPSAGTAVPSVRATTTATPTPSARTTTAAPAASSATTSVSASTVTPSATTQPTITASTPVVKPAPSSTIASRPQVTPSAPRSAPAVTARPVQPTAAPKPVLTTKPVVVSPKPVKTTVAPKPTPKPTYTQVTAPQEPLQVASATCTTKTRADGSLYTKANIAVYGPEGTVVKVSVAGGLSTSATIIPNSSSTSAGVTGPPNSSCTFYVTGNGSWTVSPS